MARKCRACLEKAWNIFCLLTVEPALFLVALGNGLADTATWVLMYDKVCITMLNDVEMCVARNLTSEDEIMVTQEASLWEFYRTLMLYLPAIFLIVIYSNLVDRWSKKYTMLFAPIGYILSMIVYLVCSIYLESSPGYMLLGALALGLSGGGLAMMGSCFSYLSATASPGMLIIHISMAEAALLASNSISAFASGVLLEAIGYTLVYVIGIIIDVVLVLYILIRIKNIPLSASVLAESLSSGPSSSSVTSEDATKKVDEAKTKVDDKLELQMEVVPEFEITGKLNFYVENGLTPQDKIVDGMEEADMETGKSHLGFNGYSSTWDNQVGLMEKVPETEAVVESGSLSTVSNGLPHPSMNSHNEPQPQQTSSPAISSAIHPNGSKSTTSCYVCSRFTKVVRTVWSYVRMYVDTAIRRRAQNKRKCIIAILCIMFIEVICGYAAEYGLCYLFVSQPPLSWSTATYGYYMGLVNGMKGLCLLLVLPLFKRLNVQYTKAFIISLVSSIISSTVFALSQNTWTAFLSAVLSLFQTALIVTARSSIVNFVEEDEHGKAFGMIASLESLGSILSTVFFNILIYPATVDIFSGLAILIASLILLIPLAIAIWLHVFTRNMARSQLQVSKRAIS